MNFASKATFLSLIAAVLAVACIGATNASAAAGDLDPQFGSGGVSRQSFSIMGDLVAGVSLEADGKLVVGGSSSNDSTGNYGFAIARFASTGQLDTSFGTGGVSRLDVAGQLIFATGMVRQADGKFVIGGTGNTEVYLARFGANGGLDTTYNAVGYLSRNWGVNNFLNSLSLLSSGAVLASGTENDGFAMGSYTAGGANNAIFNPGPLADKTVQLSAADQDSSLASAVMPDGRFVLAGRARFPGTGFEFAAARFLPDGTPDPTFGGGDGITLVPAPVEDTGQINDIELAADGSVFAAGSTGTGPESDAVLLKLTPAGALDGSFGAGGISNIGLPGDDSALSLVAAPDGKLVVTGSTGNAAANNVLLARTSASGVLDAGFGSGGRVVTDLGGDDEGVDVVVRPDLNIVVGSSSAVNGVQTHDFVLLQYQGTTAPVVAPAVPASRIKSPSKRKQRAKTFKRIAGTAGPAGLVSRVQIAVRRVDRSALKKKRCVWLASSRAKFKKNRSTGKKCRRQVWLRAGGTTKWSFKLKRKLAPGNYEIFARTTLTTGAVQTVFSSSDRSFRRLKLTK